MRTTCTAAAALQRCIDRSACQLGSAPRAAPETTEPKGATDNPPTVAQAAVLQYHGRTFAMDGTGVSSSTSTLMRSRLFHLRRQLRTRGCMISRRSQSILHAMLFKVGRGCTPSDRESQLTSIIAGLAEETANEMQRSKEHSAAAPTLALSRCTANVNV